MPWPMVQPSAVMPPKPIRMPPTMWMAVSSASRKPSQRKFFDGERVGGRAGDHAGAEAMP